MNLLACRCRDKYFGKISETEANNTYDPDTNILIQVFKEQFIKLNPTRKNEADEILRSIRNELDNDDLGRTFYQRLISVSPIKLVDFENADNNVYHVTAEFTCKNGQDEFRPDITLFINGLPLVFAEVKKPNNKGGMIAESSRMNDLRFPNKKFRRFINITQLMLFSNNMEYDTMGGIVPLQGTFYCTSAKKEAPFNCFREENKLGEQIAPFNKNYPYKAIDTDVERRILEDFNCQVLIHASEYRTSLNINTPLNRVLTSMCSPQRLLFILKYGIAYVRFEREEDGKINSVNQKHIMRYQQMFASLAVKQKLDEGKKSGVIWHTQGSGKTALSYYLNRYLLEYFAKQNKVAKFYFIVDRLDLLEQASQEFEARGLEVKTANSRQELMEQFRVTQSLQGHSGKAEITVVNIQRFAEDKQSIKLENYATNLQRIFIIDEAHRGYNPKGSFLANLFQADPNSIKIALTGTPLLKEERASWKIFGEYFHAYYYDKSIEDGYTLKIIREDIETSYRDKLTSIYDKLEMLFERKDVSKSQIVEHDNYVKELLRYIITDMKNFRVLRGDNTLGGMVICESSTQARKLYAFFDEIQAQLNAEASNKSTFKVGLILHDSDDKETRKQIIKDFKKNMTIDILIVFNMLLTGFDAPRLKRLYFGRKLKEHNLLQAITRVNRPYKDNRFGYLVDFANIKDNFERTNEAYLEELGRVYEIDDNSGNIKDTFRQLIQAPEELIKKLKDTRQILFNFTTDNLEEFSSEIAQVDNKDQLVELKNHLIEVRDSYNIVRSFGDEGLKETFEKLKIDELSQLIKIVSSQLYSVTLKQALLNEFSNKDLINQALSQITFTFEKKGEEELKILSGQVELNDKFQKTLHYFIQNVDQDDPELFTLQELFYKKFKQIGIKIASMEEYNEYSHSLDEFYQKLMEIKRRNDVLLKKYNGDEKFLRVHKRIREKNQYRANNGKQVMISDYEESIKDFLINIKNKIDKRIYDQNDILNKDTYFEKQIMSFVVPSLKELGLEATREDRLFITDKISEQYLGQYKSIYA